MANPNQQLMDRKVGDLLNVNSTLESFQNTLQDILESCAEGDFFGAAWKWQGHGGIDYAKAALNCCIAKIVSREQNIRQKIYAAETIKAILEHIRSKHDHITEGILRATFSDVIYYDLVDRNMQYQDSAQGEAARKCQAVLKERILAISKKVLENQLFKGAGEHIARALRRMEAEEIAKETLFRLQQENRELVIWWLSGSSI